MALGIPEYLTADMVKEGAVIIDVGITRVADKDHPKGYVIKGDVAFDEVAQKSQSYYARPWRSRSYDHCHVTPKHPLG